MSRHPLVKWAQRPDHVFITVELPDAKNVKVYVVPEGKFTFSAASGADDIPYEIDIDLYDKIDANESKVSISSRHIVCLVKKAESKWWSRLLKQEGKPPLFLKVDWEKWVDEDDETPANDMDFGDFDFSKLKIFGGGDGEEESDEEDDESDTDKENENQDEAASAKGEAKAATDNGEAASANGAAEAASANGGLEAESAGSESLAKN